MSDHDTIPPEADDELRIRLQAFGQEVKGRTDTEAALERLPSRSRPPTVGLLAIAACFVLVVAVVATFIAGRQSVDTVPPADSPTTECSSPDQPRAITQGAQMKNRFAAPVATAATALMLLGACSDDDGPTTLAQGDDIEFVGEDGLGGQTLDISAEDDDGEVSGEALFTDSGGQVVVAIECADTDTDGVVILGGTITESTDPMSGLVALFIREGDPDSMTIWFDEGENESCSDVLENRHDVLDDESAFVDVEAGSNIETG
jgi:hypothetical protein